VSLLQAKLAFDGGFEALAQLGCAVHGKHRFSAIQEHVQMRALAGLNAPQSAPDGVRMAGLQDFARLLPQTDWLLLACPLTDQTRRLVDASALALLCWCTGQPLRNELGRG